MIVGAAWVGCGSSNDAGEAAGAEAGVDPDAAFDAPTLKDDAGIPAFDAADATPPPIPCDAPNAPACAGDTWCDLGSGSCVPFGPAHPHDDVCQQTIAPGNFAPITKCEFPKQIPIPGDAFPNHVDVQATPMVARLDGPNEPPSIVVAFEEPVPPPANGYTEYLGVIRVLRGTDCEQQATIGGEDFDGDGDVDWIRSPSPVAIADLDGDGRPEIIAYTVSGPTGTDEALMAFTKKPTDAGTATWKPLWATKKATLKDGTTHFNATVPALDSEHRGNWAGPSVHDLDDDGVPEIIREGWVFDGATGVMRADLPDDYATYSFGIPAVLANLDDDPAIELTNGAHVWQFDAEAGAWIEDATYETVTTSPGWAAIADFDPYDGKHTPEIAVATGGRLAIYRTDHSVFMNVDVHVPEGGGGPPTIADFDGDGLPEVALAGEYYTVFDPDCQATPRPGGKCNADRVRCDSNPSLGTPLPGTCPDMILWSRAAQDVSSDTTSSSIFDFEADGKAEVVYADECFARVYSGADGKVIFSRYHSSCTWQENPVVADVDGDFRAELVVPSNTSCGAVGVGMPCERNLEQGDIDIQFAGLVCQQDSDCVSHTCVQGLCRCVTSKDCCAEQDDAKCEDFGTKCADPPADLLDAGGAGAAKTCRANHPHGLQGIRVYEDAHDNWVRSRTIWNQHAYAVTHVNEDGTVPKTSAWASNWTQSGLDDFRQNVPGTPHASDIGDLTAQNGSFACHDAAAVMSSAICNRGVAPIGPGVSVAFAVGPQVACRAHTTLPLDPGQCETVSCTWVEAPGSPTDVAVIPDDDGAIAQCDEANDRATVPAVECHGTVK